MNIIHIILSLMKKILLSTIALFTLAAVNIHAQSIIFQADKSLPVPEKTADLNDAMKVLPGGIVINGDTREPVRVAEKPQGMRIEAKKRAFVIGGKTQLFTSCLSTHGAAAAIKEGGEVKPDNCPRSRMMQVKPLSDGMFTFAISGSSKDASGNRIEECKLYVGVRNGDTYRNLAILDWKQGNAKGTKSSPLPTVSLDYAHTAGDEIYIYADNNVNIFAIAFTGKTDTQFQGNDPVAVNKAVRKARK